MPAPVDVAFVRALVVEVDRFHLRDRGLRRSQSALKAKLESGAALSDEETAAYLSAVRLYFSGFAREAQAHLRDIERRLAKVSQLQFNLTAERGVAARRVEIAQGVLSKLAELRDE
jgi:hypothetical protein